MGAVTAQAQTALTTINGSPLKINVGADGSFQVYNTAVPGVGQIFPTNATLADMGVFAWIDGILYAPNFGGHGGTATANLGTYTAWKPLQLTQTPLGLGTVESPYVVSTTLGAGETDVRVNVTVTYVRGNNFFRVRKHVYSTTNSLHDVDVHFGADIYLASSDNGVFLSVPELAAVGGRTCDGVTTPYNILLIPVTNASRYTTAHYSEVWSQIKANNLDNNTEPTSCVDNGAAIQWNNIMSGGSTSVAVDTAVSFGAIPSAANFHGFFIDVEPDTLEMVPGESRTLTITSKANAELEFNSAIAFAAANLPPGMSIAFHQDTIPAPGNGTITATLSVGNEIFPQTYQNIGIFGSGGNETRGAFLRVSIACTPPFILGTKQPQTTTVPRGTRATLRVQPEAAGLYTYQWYQGFAPLVGNPIANSNSATFVTPPVNEIQQYWARVSNPCGTVDSLTATVIPTF
ncbi:MAG TPA: hypothetical protein VF787_23290 [Thermoanaerobaculia bacterium]